MKIFITGSSGFIGFHLAKKLLDKGFKICGYDSMNSYYDTKLKKSRLNILKKYKNFKFVKNNIENYKILKGIIVKFKPKIIIHLAAQAGVRYSLKNPDAYLQSNIIGTFNRFKFFKLYFHQLINKEDTKLLNTEGYKKNVTKIIQLAKIEI